MDFLLEPKLPLREPVKAQQIDAGTTQDSCRASCEPQLPPVGEDPLGFSMCGMAG